ncbi:hypothetical protein JCM10212_001168 [Sporobolomyces blumeae]
MSVLVLSHRDVERVTATLSAPSLCDMLASTMLAISTDNQSSASDATVAPIQNPQRIATGSLLHKTLYMPSRLTTSQGSATSIKVVAVPKPTCRVPGLPATTLLMDESTGRVRAVVNASELTGIRTAAASALATRTLADPDARNLVVFGSGTQAYWHARLILELFPSIARVRFVVRETTDRSRSLVDRITAEFPRVESSSKMSSEAANVVTGADIICTCVPSTTPLFNARDLKRSVHINAIGSYTPTMVEFPPSLISPRDQTVSTSTSITTETPTTTTTTTTMTKDEPDNVKIETILVDSRDACLAEAGELIQAGIHPSNCIEIGQLFSPRAPSSSASIPVPKDDAPSDAVLRPASGPPTLRSDPESLAVLDRLGRGAGRRSLFKCVGVGGMDVAITRAVVDEAERLGFGSRVEFF